MVRHEYEKLMKTLDKEIALMGALCEQSVAMASKAILNKDHELAKQSGPLDDEIDKKERAIEELCLKIILQQQPVASDFRRVSAALKLITDMERIGDEATAIVELLDKVKYNNEGRDYFKKMASTTVSMLGIAIESFVKRDIKSARKIEAMDDVVDQSYESMKDWLVKEITEDPANGKEYMELFLASKYFERIGDHIVNISEWVEFSVTGVHKGERIS